jgi:hemoglobin-like flavoprotein
MTPEQIATVQRTLSELAAVPGALDAMAADFYRRLFAADPSTEALFSTDPAVQRAKFVDELDQIIGSIRDHQAFLDRAAALGAGHESYGVRPRHYETAGAALLAALAAALGPAWTDGTAEAWSRAYDLTTTAMLSAPSGVQPSRR